MKAKVQYNDLVGTASADITDNYQNSLQNYLISNYESYEGERFDSVGCSIFVSGQHLHPKINIVFVCYDKQNRKYVKFCPIDELSNDEILSLFKRFNIVVGKNIDNIEVDEIDYQDLK